MSSSSPNSSLNLIGGPEWEYVECVLLFKESNAIRPGSTRIHQISIKPVTVTGDYLNLHNYSIVGSKRWYFESSRSTWE